MEHIIQHSNKAISIRIEVKSEELSPAVNEILQKANDLIEMAKRTVANYHLRLQNYPAGAKIPCIRELRIATGLGLKEAKDLVERMPCTLLEGSLDQLKPLYNALKGVNADVRIYNDAENTIVDVMED
jgi:ribosomal protein L7/L12